jgi:hypothetical protein
MQTLHQQYIEQRLGVHVDAAQPMPLRTQSENIYLVRIAESSLQVLSFKECQVM